MVTTDTTFDDAGSYEVRTDESTNTLYITLTGKLSEDRMRQAADEAVAAAASLDDGFAVINDISTFSPPSPEAAAPIASAQKELATMGVGDVVRVVDDDTSAVVTNAFGRRSRKAGYDGRTATTVQAAERALGV